MVIELCVAIAGMIVSLCACTPPAPADVPRTQAPANQPNRDSSETPRVGDGDKEQSPVRQARPRRPKWPLADFPKSVVGFGFGSTLDQAVATCKRVGGAPGPVVARVPSCGLNSCSITCDILPVEIDIPDAIPGVTICGPENTVCEVLIGLLPPAGEYVPRLQRIRGMLVEKYGEPNLHEGNDAASLTSDCLEHGHSESTEGWVWGKDGPNFGATIRLRYWCDRAPFAEHVGIYYDDLRGWQWRVRQLETRTENY